MERKALRKGMKIAVRPAGGRRQFRTMARRHATITDLRPYPKRPLIVEIAWADTGSTAAVNLRRMTTPATVKPLPIRND